jgi:hypothetical protein
MPRGEEVYQTDINQRPGLTAERNQNLKHLIFLFLFLFYLLEFEITIPYVAL